MDEPRSLDSLFKEKLLRIPDYQRGYAWRREHDDQRFVCVVILDLTAEARLNQWKCHRRRLCRQDGFRNVLPVSESEICRVSETWQLQFRTWKT